MLSVYEMGQLVRKFITGTAVKWFTSTWVSAACLMCASIYSIKCTLQNSMQWPHGKNTACHLQKQYAIKQ